MALTKDASRLWFVEVWLDIRDRFKALVGDAILFIVVLIVLEIVSVILGRMDYPASKKQILEHEIFRACAGTTSF